MPVRRGLCIAVACACLTACPGDPPTLNIDTDAGSSSGSSSTSAGTTTGPPPDPDSSGGDTTSSTSSTSAADSTSGTTGDTGSGGGSSESTGPVSTKCAEIVTFEMMPAQATLSGGWSLARSMVGEGEIASYDAKVGGGSVLYEPDIPCDATWHIWARYWDNGNLDSYLATLDGQPAPAAIFEGDCTNGQANVYDWAQLNWRDEAAGACVYVEDPWTPQWDAGVHAIEFSFRESIAMGRILITNDPAFVPN